MTTPARYPTRADVEKAIAEGYWLTMVADHHYNAIIRAAINIERERVAKEAGVPLSRDEICKIVGDLLQPHVDLGDSRFPAGWAISMLHIASCPDQYDSPKEPAAVEAQNSAVKVPDDVMAAARFLVDSAKNRASATVYEFLQSLTQTTETPR